MKKRGLIFSLAAVLVLSLSAAALAFGPDIVGHMGFGWGGMHGPGWGGGPGMRGGMMGYGGYGMMGSGGMQGFAGQPCAAYGSGTLASGTEITKDSVASMANAYLARLGNPNLKLGEIKELDKAFEVSIVTKDNSLVNRYTVDKKTGFTSPIN